MPTPVELAVRASVEQGVASIRQLVEELGAVRKQSKETSESTKVDAAASVEATMKQREALMVLVAEYKEVGASAGASAEKQEIAAKLAADAQMKANALIRETGATSTKAAGGIGLMGKAIGVAFGGAIVVAGVKKIIDAGKEAQTSIALLANTMKDAGQSYAENRRQIESNIDAEARLSGVTHVELRTSFMTLDRLTGSVTKGLKDMGIATDIAKARHMSMAAATKLVSLVEMGRVAQLRRMGIVLPTITTAEDKLRDSHAKTTTAVKAAAKAWDAQQTAIAGVAALHKAYAGSAATYGKTEAGAVDRAKESWNELEVWLAGKMLPVLAQVAGWLGDEITKLRESKRAHDDLKQAVKFVVAAYDDLVPIVRAGVTVFRDVVGWLDKHTTVAEVLAGTIVSLVAAYKTYTLVTKIATAAQLLLDGAMDANPIGLVVTAIAALAAGLYLAYQHSATMRKILNETAADIKAVVVPVWKVLSGAAVEAFDFIRKHWQLVLLMFGPLGAAVDIVIKYWKQIAQGVEHPIATIEGLWNSLFVWLEETSIKVALKVIEPFTHIPGFLGGGWAQSMKKNLTSALDGLEAPSQDAGTRAGSALGMAMQVAFAPSLAALNGQVGALFGSIGGAGGAPGQAGDPNAKKGAAGTTFGLLNEAHQLGVGSGAVYATGGGHGGISKPGQVLDCSGYIYQIFTQNGFQGFPGTSETQYSTNDGPNWTSKFIVPSQVQPGDVIFMVGSPKYPSPGHVGIVVSGSGTGAIVMQYYSTGQQANTIRMSAIRDFVAAKRFYLAVKGATTTTKSKPPGTTPLPNLGTADTTTLPASVTAAASAGAAATAAAAAKKAATAAAKGKLTQSGVDSLDQQVKDTQAKIADLLPDRLKTELQKRAEAIMGSIHKGLTSKETDQVRSDLTKLKSDTASALRLDTGVKAAKQSIAQIKAELTGWPASVKGPLEEKISELSGELGKVLKPSDLAKVKSNLTALKNAVKAAMAAAKAEVAAARTTFEREWGQFTTAALDAFDKVTQATLATQKITVQMGGYSFQYGQGDSTPAAKQLAALQAQADQAQRDQALASAQSGLANAQAALAAGTAGGSSLGDLQQAVTDAQASLDAAMLDQRESDLQKQADAEQTAADSQYTSWSDSYQATRDTQRQVLSDQLADLQTAIETQKTTWAGAMADLQTILGKGGAAAATAFWTAYNAATAATVAAGGQDPTGAAKSAAAALGAAQATASAEGALTSASAAAALAAARGAGYKQSSGALGRAGIIPFATGGMITRPTMALMGEKPGSREAILPLTDDRAMAMIVAALVKAGLGGGGGSVTAIFPNAIIPGRDRDAARRIARMTAPEIRRQIGYPAPV